MALTSAEILRLRRMAGESSKPDEERMLDDATLQDIADEVGLVVDSLDQAPDHASYTATYDLYRTAAEGWREKAGMIAEGYNIKVEGAQFNRSEAYEHYLKQATRYAGMANNLTALT